LALQSVRERHQSPEICMQAVQQNGDALEFVKEQTLEICLAAVNQNGRGLLFVKEHQKFVKQQLKKMDLH